ncbi:MAG TPA: hypothetical protein PLX87_01220 [Bacteroidales bacterium]|nr:hypothetical protein [Bacteroidales bacterium]HPP91883.1 hypothetical protein [Bacteroidales bacterium]HQK71600.1 hypothetical protein [Bacteroidales bacterium]HRT48416.1 hypothetical protein [Bacteroidales bacterium]HRU57605.1 hypothetical protein [Bacteroidales bacterium]
MKICHIFHGRNHGHWNRMPPASTGIIWIFWQIKERLYSSGSGVKINTHDFVNRGKGKTIIR